MKHLKVFMLGLLVCAFAAWAADRFEVKGVKYYVTNSGEPIVGHITVADDKLIFVDDTNPGMTFTVLRAGVKTTRVDNGRIVFDLADPVMIQDAQQSNLVMLLPDPNTNEQVLTWVKVKK
jgi:hypothetical protein